MKAQINEGEKRSLVERSRARGGDEPRHGRETRHPAKMTNKLINQNRKSSIKQNRRARKH